MPEAPSAERRRGGRSRTFLAGILVYGPGSLTADCAVRNVTADGAQVRLTAPVELAGPILLLLVAAGEAYDAEVVWRRGNDLGLTFNAPCNLKDPYTDRERTARRLWIERLPRESSVLER